MRTVSPSTATGSEPSTSRAGSVTTAPATVTRPSNTSCSEARREATPAWARYLARRTVGGPPYPGSRGPPAPRRDPRRRRRARLPLPPGLALGVGRRHRLRRDDRPARRPARAAGRRAAVLDARARARGPRQGRHGEGALPHPRRPRRRGRADALPRRPPLGLRLLAVGLPADVHVLRHRHDE